MADVKELAANAVTADTAVVTTTETVAVSSGRATIPTESARVVVIAFAVLTTGTATTTVTPRIRRGTAITGTLIGEANAITIGAAVGSNEHYNKHVIEEVEDLNEVEYSLTLQQAAATGNGTILEASILVLVT